MNRPGLAKAHPRPLVLAVRRMLVRTSDPEWRALLDGADTMSEGAVREEAEGRTWYGSTSLVLAAAKANSPLLAALASRDVHLRVRAMRAALREASLRAPSRLGRVACEVRVSVDPSGVRIDVDLQAPLIEGRRKSGHHRSP